MSAVVGGIGMGMVFVPLFDIVMADVRPHEMGSASGVLQTVNSLSMSAGAAGLGAIFFSLVRVHASHAATFVSAAQWTTLATVALLASAFVTGFWLPRRARDAEPARSADSRDELATSRTDRILTLLSGWVAHTTRGVCWDGCPDRYGGGLDRSGETAMKSKAAIQRESRGPLVIEEIDIPDPGPNQVTVRNFASGVCYSQVHQLGNPALPRPMGLGHEGSGVVTQVGKEVTHVKEGEHVITTWVPRIPITGLPVSRPTGATLHGRPVIADGDVYTWSEHMVTFADKVVPMSQTDPTDITCLIGCAVLTGAGAVLHTAKVRLGQSVAVFGVGGVGLSAIAAAAIAGADPIIAVDLVDRKLQFAREFGATHGINASNTDPVKAIRAISPGGVDYALDAVGAPTTALQILEAVKEGGPRADNQGGTAVLLGIPVSDVPMDLNAILLYQRHYCGSLGASEPETDFPLFLEWVREGKFPLGKLVTDRYSLDQIEEARVALEEGRILGRAIIEM